ncbi:HU family DNA-binding protein [Candidatus Hydrogenedentota bacterium]
MNKGTLVEAVCKELGGSKADAERAVNAVLCCIKKGLKKDKAVQLIGFGTFDVRKRKARTGRNPRTGESIKIKASRSVGFKAGKAFKDMI